MTTLRSGALPARLRQLISSSEGSFGPSLHLHSEPPSKIQSFIEKVIQTPLQDIAIPLTGFRWEYKKGNFHHWRALFHHFDSFFKTYLSNRNDLLLSNNVMGDDTPFPKYAVLQILRVMQIILDNCHNKSSFDGLEHFKLLLASADPEVLVATLETLSSLVKIPASKLHVSGKMIGLGSINNCLLSLAQGWGSKEEGLGLYTCVVANEKSQEGLSLFPSYVQDKDERSHCRLGSTLYFDVHGVSPQRTAGSSNDASTSTIIHIPDVHEQSEGGLLLLLKKCIEEYRVPSEQRFSLLTRIRYAHAFHAPRSCRLYSRICLLAFIVLMQSNDANDELVSFFANDPEYTNELIKIVRSEETISGDVRTLAMIALGAQLAAYSSSHDRGRVLNGSSINFGGRDRTILLNVLQKAILSLEKSTDPSSLAFVEALLQFYLLYVISTSSSGSVIRGSGMVPTFLPLLKDSDPAHLHLVYYAVKTLQKLMDYSNAAVTLFKDLGGHELLARRLQVEVQRVIGPTSSDDSMVNVGECSSSREDDLYAQRRLIRALLKALGSAAYAPTNTSRSQGPEDSLLPSTLALIFANMVKFGGDIYCAGVTLMSEFLHKDPTSFPILHEMGLPSAFLSSVGNGILPSSKALTCIPSGLGAICLNTKGLESVKEASALRFLVDILTSKKYVVALNDAIVPLANGVEELLRHVSSLRIDGVDIIIEILNSIANLGESCSSGSSKNADGNTGMNMDSEESRIESGSRMSVVDITDSTVENITDEHFINLTVFHVMVLVHKTMENTETCRLFVEKSGIDALLKLLLRPAIAQSSEGMAIALHSTMVFKSFTQHHSAVLARTFCAFLRDLLKKVLVGFGLVSGSFLLDPKTKPDHTVFSSLFLVEFLLFLASAKETRWVSSLLAEFGGESKDVLEDIGRVHREILWQITLLDDAKVEKQEDGPSDSTLESQQVSTANNSVEQRVTSFRQLLDPMLRRRTSEWGVESQFFDLMNLYRDLGRAAGIQNRSTLNLRLGSSQQPSQTSGSDADSAIKLEDKQKNYYSSCCDMVRSLSSHIVHLFQELGKATLPSRRRDDAVNLSPPSKLVVSTLASISLGHLNFGGQISTNGSEASIAGKCRYFGKVVEFIDSILMDRHDSCNPVLLNCLYGQGVIQSVLTTFEATSQLLFAVPASPMDTDDEKHEKKKESVHSWLYGPLAAYGKLMDHLVTSSYILSPSTKHLLLQPLSDCDVPFPRDAETFVKVIQSMVLKAVLPLWTHPQFADCSPIFITSIIAIVRQIYCGVELKNIIGGNSGRLAGPPPNEASISTIVEMGFTRPRAEEALRQVGVNSVELAMEWLFSHPEEEVQEDDELARAMAMSLGNSGPDSHENAGNEISLPFEEELAKLPELDELLSTCVKLLQSEESLAFPVRDLLLTMCAQNDGLYRPNVISFVIDHIKQSTMVAEDGNSSILSALFHVLALILHEDAASQETCLNNGLIQLASDMLSQWDTRASSGTDAFVPKWVTTAFLTLGRLLQVDPKLNPEVVELLKKTSEGSKQMSILIGEEKQNKSQESVDHYVDLDQRKRLVEVACSCIRKQLPSETTHAVLQLCAALTKSHPVAVSFLNAGGVPLLLNLPTKSMFSGFDSTAASIIRHILEDPQTLQQAMELEIRHNVVTSTSRQSSGRLTVRNFLASSAAIISRDPVVFMRAAQSVCQIEMVGDRPYIVLLKDREKEKPKDKEKPSSVGVPSVLVSGGQGKLQESKSFKSHRKAPFSFVNVVELLLETVVTFEPSVIEDPLPVASGTPSSTDMDIDIATSKGKGKAVASVPEDGDPQNEDAAASLAKVVFILKLLVEIVVAYPASIHVLLRKDSEVSSGKGLSGSNSRGILHHSLHKFVPYSRNVKQEKRLDGDWKLNLAERARQFLVAACVRSGEARRRVFTDINSAFSGFVESAEGYMSPSTDIDAFIDLLNEVLVARSPTGSCISSEASSTFIDAGLVKSLTCLLQVLDLDLADTSKGVTGIIKALELVTKEHIRSADAHTGKGDASPKPSDVNMHDRADGAQAMEAGLQENDSTGIVVGDNLFSVGNNYDDSEAVTDDMEHDQDLDGGFASHNGDDYMHDTLEDGEGLENGVHRVSIRFEIQPDGQDNLNEDDNEMSGDDGGEEMSGDDGDDDGDDEDDDDEDQHNDQEEDEDHHLPHPDTDQDDHAMDEDEFDEDVLEDDDEDGDEEEEGLILRLEEGINGINVLDHIEVFGRDHSLTSETLQVMPVELFGSRRQGRSNSIYNLLGRSDSNAPLQHPLLVDSQHLSTSATARASETGDLLFPDRGLGSTPSRLDTIFRSARNGRPGHRFNLWHDDHEQAGGASSSTIPQGLEEFVISQLTRSKTDKPSEQNSTAVVSEGMSEDVPQVDASMGTEMPVGANLSDQGEQNSTAVVSEGMSEDVPKVDASMGTEMPVGANLSDQGDYLQASSSAPGGSSNPEGLAAQIEQLPSIELQLDHTNASTRVFEAVSQESGGSGATLGESLRSLDVETESADGHDDGGDRVPPGEPRGRGTSLRSVSDIEEIPMQEAEGVHTDGQQIAGDTESVPIDPTFLDALPDELRAEVLSAQQGQSNQPTNAEQQNTGDIDPEFLAALPPDIRSEILAQQQFQRIHQSQELDGQPVEMDAESIIATFPSDIREEVLLTSSDAVLANLTPALVAEANLLRERFANRYSSGRTLFGMHPRSRRGESSRRGEGSSLGRSTASRRLTGTKMIEADGAPLVDTDALKGMVRLLHVVQPIYKGQYQRLLLNLCAHSESRIALVKILMEMLVNDKRKSSSQSSDSEPSYRLYGCQSHVMYSLPQFLDGVPPLVSRRVLETLTYLARHPSVAKVLLELRLLGPSYYTSEKADQTRGKALMTVESNTIKLQEGDSPSVALLLGLLNQPLYLRSITHLEQLLNLLDVVIDNAGSKSLSSKPEVSTPGVPTTDPLVNVDPGTISSEAVAISKPDESSKPSTSGSKDPFDVLSVLHGLPPGDLRLLCSLLATEGLSDNAYALVSELLKKLVAFSRSHCHLFITELATSARHLSQSAMRELHLFGDSEGALLHSSSADGAAILRVLQSLSSLVTSLKEKEDQENPAEKEQNFVFSPVEDIISSLEPLWLELSTCITRIEGYTDFTFELPSSSLVLKSKPSSATPLPAGTQNLLPYIESFFITCEKIQPAQPGTSKNFADAAIPESEDASTSVSKQHLSGPVTKVDEKHGSFVKFTEKHRKLLNAFIRQNPGLLEKSFSLVLKVPRFIDFDNKRAHFRSKIKHQHDHHHRSPLRISVRRAYILEDSYNQLRMRSTQELKGRLTVNFQGEEGIDAGGLTREWYQSLSRVIFDKGALLFTTVGNDSTFQPNPNSVYQTEHLSYFKFVGRVVGKAVFDGQLLDVHFTRSFYKHILGVKVTYHDIEAIDPDYYKNLKWMLENDISDVLDLTFSIDADEEKLILYERTQVTDYELIPGGRNIKVTEENKHQYVDLVVEHRLTTAIRPQINAFLEGFNELVTGELISIFNDKELELLISGLPDIDLDDMKTNTDYSGYSPASPIIQWFWDVVQAFSKEDKARLLQFVTGTSKVPLEGFSALQGISGSQKFQIHKAYGSVDHLPSAHTCFNQLDLPEYPSKEHLQERLLLAIHEANEGFGFG